MLETNKDNVSVQPQMFETQIEENNVFAFSNTLNALKNNLDPKMLRQRNGGIDKSGHIRTFDYVEWHTVADVLDNTAPNWGHTVKSIDKVGDVVVITVAITIDGVTREGIGTGSARTETGIKKAEHDALKRAAVKFGIARGLYKTESSTANRSDASKNKQIKGQEKLDHDPIAKTISELITTKQMGMIRAVAREKAIDADGECTAFMGCRINELSRKAASKMIEHLQSINVETPLKLAS